jgi:SNF2 family DNA or RNA helicase
LSVTLFSFQQEAVDKLTRPKITSRLIGDEMGLGKTFESLAIDVKHRKDIYDKSGIPTTALKTLIIARGSAFDHWEETIYKFAPRAKVVVINPKNRPAFIRALKDPHVHFYIIHWDGVRLIEELKRVAWFHIIADEVHKIKNRNAKTTKALKQIRNVKYKTGISGTPADDKPEDLWSVLNWLWPNYKGYTSYHRFVNHYCLYDTETNWGTGAQYKKFVGVKNVASLHKEMEPWFVRRKKADVMEDLPDKYYNTVWVDLLPQQRKAYDEMKKEMIAWVEMKKETESAPLAAPAVIAQLTRLQQFAMGYMESYIEKHRRRNKDKTDWIRDKVTGEPIWFEELKWRIVDPSSKIDALMDIVDEAPNDQLIVFSQFQDAVHMVGERLKQRNISFVPFTGDINQADRGKYVTDFQKGNIQVFASTIATGGESITLTAASHVIFLDRSWKPVANKQAEDRAHRVGQKNAVQITDIMARNTVDMGRRQRIEQKWEYIQKMLGDIE